MRKVNKLEEMTQADDVIEYWKRAADGSTIFVRDFFQVRFNLNMETVFNMEHLRLSYRLHEIKSVFY